MNLCSYEWTIITVSAYKYELYCVCIQYTNYKILYPFYKLTIMVVVNSCLNVEILYIAK